jgi:hypothetical protein
LPDEIKIFCIVKKHLGDDILTACIDLFLQVLNVGLQIRGLGMLFRIPGYPDRKIGMGIIYQIIILVNP